MSLGFNVFVYSPLKMTCPEKTIEQKKQKKMICLQNHNAAVISWHCHTDEIENQGFYICCANFARTRSCPMGFQSAKDFECLLAAGWSHIPAIVDRSRLFCITSSSYYQLSGYISKKLYKLFRHSESWLGKLEHCTIFLPERGGGGSSAMLSFPYRNGHKLVFSLGGTTASTNRKKLLLIHNRATDQNRTYCYMHSIPWGIQQGFYVVVIHCTSFLMRGLTVTLPKWLAGFSRLQHYFKLFESLLKPTCSLFKVIVNTSMKIYF